MVQYQKNIKRQGKTMENQNKISQNETSKYSNTETNKIESVNPKLSDEEERRRRCLMLEEMRPIPTYYL